MTEADSRKLQPLDDYRTAIRIRVSLGGREVDVVNTHLAWQADAAAVRARQIANLMAWIPRDGAPLIVMGDFNAVPEDAGLAALKDLKKLSQVDLRYTQVTQAGVAALQKTAAGAKIDFQSQ